MNINQIKAFLLLADGHNVSDTAKLLFCTQPSVTIKLQKLENELQTTLFERVNNRLYLTPQGKIYQQYATQIMNLLKASSEHIRQFDNPSKGEIKFGASNFVGVHLLPQVMATFKKQSPFVKLSMDVSSSDQLIKKLDEHELEFLIMSDHISLDPNKYEITNFLSDELILICSSTHWLCDIKYCNFSDIASEFFLLKKEHSSTRDFIFKQIKKLGIKIDSSIELNSLEGIKKGVIHGLGISIVSKLSVVEELKSGLLYEINIIDIDFKRNIRYFYRKGKNISPASESFLSILKSNSSSII